MSVYTTAGATMSEKNVTAAYQLSADQLRQGVEGGNLKLQWRSCHGNSYRLFIRSEVEAYAKLVGPDPALKAVHDASQAKQRIATKHSRYVEVTKDLETIDARKNAMMKDMDAKKVSLTNEKAELEKRLNMIPKSKLGRNQVRSLRHQPLQLRRGSES
jgi:hypothetical protein